MILYLANLRFTGKQMVIATLNYVHNLNQKVRLKQKVIKMFP